MVTCSIVTSVYNRLPVTRMFIESVRKHTSIPYEFIVVDNGSTDGTKEYLQGLSDITLVRNESNLGVSKAWNQGVQIAQSPYVCICNNDVVVTPGWLESLINEMEMDYRTGMISPVENTYIWTHPHHFPNEPIIHKRDGPIEWTEAGLERFYGGFQSFAESFVHRNANLRIFDIHFCVVLIRRELFDLIGLFEEGFGKAFWEDVDFAQRVLLSRRWNRLEVFGGSYVHHFGNATSCEFGYKQLLESGRAFLRKWGSLGDQIYQDLKLNQLTEQRLNQWREIWKGKMP